MSSLIHKMFCRLDERRCRRSSKVRIEKIVLSIGHGKVQLGHRHKLVKTRLKAKQSARGQLRLKGSTFQKA